jgi:glycerol-3-phosphate acyltransferase PlsY
MPTMVAVVNSTVCCAGFLAVATGLAAYLLGAIPCGLLLGRLRGIDIRETGSGNIGATNVFRSVGKGFGALTLLLDAAKGFVPAFVFPRLVTCGSGNEPSLKLAVLCACLAVIGHNWPVYLKFKGGKGVATSAGAMSGIVPAALGLAVIAWGIAFILTRYVSVASIAAAVVMVAAVWWLYMDTAVWLPGVVTILGAIAVWRHRANIARLRQGTENRIEFRKESE